MNPERQRLSLWLTAGALYALAAGVLALAWWSPLDRPAVVARAVAPASRPSTQPADDLALDAFESAAKRDLRAPLDGPGAAMFLPRAAAAPAVNIRLVGTVESGGSMRGLFVTAAGRVELRGPGEQIGGARVVAVDARRAQVNVSGAVISLALERMPGAPAGAAPPAVGSPVSAGSNPARPPLVIPEHIMPKALLERGN